MTRKDKIFYGVMMIKDYSTKSAQPQSKMTEQIAALLFNAQAGLLSPDHYEKMYPLRTLPKGAMVTRFAPSPTGLMHIGGVYMSLINKRLAEQSGGVFFLRLEDTDAERYNDDAVNTIVHALTKVGLLPHEGVVGQHLGQMQQKGNYGTYVQSQRKDIYHSFARHLIERGLAYPCFMSMEELDDIRAKQTLTKQRPGCYGKWAKWRDASVEQVQQALIKNLKYVIRLKAPGSYDRRLTWHDEIKGDISVPENDVDVVLIKSDGLPTYHFAHAVDDHLMRTTHVVRGDEWLASVPLHLQLFQAFGWQPPKYAHVGPIEKLDTHADGHHSRRKLSKRSDPEANVQYYFQKGFPVEAVLEYLTHLIASSFEDWRRQNPQKPLAEFTINFKQFSPHGALSDFDKLTSISKDIIANLDAETLYRRALEWANEWDQPLAVLMKNHVSITKNALNIERGGERRSKRLATWQDLRSQLFFIYDELFQQLPGLPFADRPESAERQAILSKFLKDYQPTWQKQEMLDYAKEMAIGFGFAPNSKIFDKNPGQYKGHFGDVMMVIRVAICGARETPDLWEVMQVLGVERVRQRLKNALHNGAVR